MVRFMQFVQGENIWKYTLTEIEGEYWFLITHNRVEEVEPINLGSDEIEACDDFRRISLEHINILEDQANLRAVSPQSRLIF